MNEMPSFSTEVVQASRVLRITSPLGKDVLLPERARISEGVNRLFEIEVAVRSKQTIKPEELIGHLVGVEVDIGQDEDKEESICRPFSGIVTELHEGPAVTRSLRSYQIILRPSLWLLSQTRDSRIWMDQTSLDVLDTLLKEHGLKHADSSAVINPLPPIHYSTQFNESDFNYLMRRLEQDGLHWWFSFDDGAHTLHVADHASGWLKPSAAARGESRVRLAQGSSDHNHIREWSRRFAYVPGVRTGADWNYKTFGTIPRSTTPTLVDLPDNHKREIFEWPAQAITNEEVERVEKLRMQATEADHERVTGTSNVRTLEAGRRFQPYDAANPDAKYEEHVIISAEHLIVDRSYETSDSEPEYRNSFEAIPSRVPLTPHRTTRKQRIEGTQIAVVAGPAGEEIHVDPDGCVKLWFPWQRDRAKKDGTDTKWIRVAQNWAGGGWGGQIIPRIAMEVLVTFIDGDPDRPLITGIVPNPTNKVPYELPANKTKSVFRTNTHKGTGFNELSFEDERDREEIYLHAQKDHTLHIENNRSKRVDNNQSESVGHNKSIEVGNNHHEVIGGNMTLMVGPNILQKAVTGAFKALTDKISGLANKLGVPDIANMGEGNLVIGVGKNKAETVMVSSTEIVGAAKATTVGGGYQLTVGGVKNESVAVGTWEEVGQTKVTVVGHKYEIVCGKSRILMERDGTIIIEGVKLLIKEDEVMKVKAGRIDLN